MHDDAKLGPAASSIAMQVSAAVGVRSAVFFTTVTPDASGHAMVEVSGAMPLSHPLENLAIADLALKQARESLIERDCECTTCANYTSIVTAMLAILQTGVASAPRASRSAAQVAQQRRAFHIMRLRGLWALASVLNPNRRRIVRIVIDMEIAAGGAETEGVRVARRRHRKTLGDLGWDVPF